MKRFLVFLTNSCDVGTNVSGSFDTLKDVVQHLVHTYDDYIEVLDLEERVWWDFKREMRYATTGYPESVNISATKRKE